MVAERGIHAQLRLPPGVSLVAIHRVVLSYAVPGNIAIQKNSGRTLRRYLGDERSARWWAACVSLAGSGEAHVAVGDHDQGCRQVTLRHRECRLRKSCIGGQYNRKPDGPITTLKPCE